MRRIRLEQRRPTDGVLRSLPSPGHTAFDGLEAVEAATHWRPDVILLDVGLPKLDGYNAARRIRAQNAHPQPIIVAVTGWGQDEGRQAAAAAGFDSHVVKSVEPEALMRLLAKLTKGRTPTPQIRVVGGTSQSGR